MSNLQPTPTENLLSTDRAVSEHSMTIEQARAKAQQEADSAGIAIAVGWQINDDGEKELGYCPASIAPHNCFVVEVLETIQPYKGGRQDYDDRVEAKRERLLGRAQRLQTEGQGRLDRAHRMAEVIPFGQPILVGHHSEGRDRRYRGRIHDNFSKGFELQEAAKQVSQRADSIGEGGISSDNPQALTLLRAELADASAVQERMRRTNKIIRKHRTDKDAAAKALIEDGWSAAGAQEMLTPDFCGRIGFPDYKLKNNSANMRRIEKRIAELESKAAIQEGERARSKSGVVFQIGDNRVQLVFPGKPAADVRDHLKRSGFRWAPSNGAWQRHLNNAGIYYAGEIIKWLDSREEA